MYTSQYLQGKLAAYLNGTAMGTPVATLKLALSTADPTDTGANLTEPANGEYARQEFTLGAPVSNEASGSDCQNVEDIAFTASGDISHFAIFDNATDEMLFYGPLSSIRTIASGTDVITVAAGALHVAFKGMFSKYLGEAALNWIRGNAMPTAPTSLKLALSTANPKRDASGIVEPDSSTGGYARQAITYGAPSFTHNTGTTLESTNAQVFGPCTNANWGAITHWALYDQGTNKLLQGALSAAKNVVVGQGYGVNAGAASLLFR